MNRTLYSTLLEAAQPLFLAVIGALSIWLSTLMNKYVKSRKLLDRLTSLGRIVDGAVATVEQQFVRDCKDPSIRTSAWDVGAKAEAKKLATLAVRSVASGLLAELPSLGITDVNALLAQEIERGVAALTARLDSGAITSAALASIRPPPLPARATGDDRETPPDPLRPSRVGAPGFASPRALLVALALLVTLGLACSAAQRSRAADVACALAPAGEVGLNFVVNTLVDVVTGGTALDPAITGAIDNIEQAIDARANAACAARDAGATMAARAPASLRLRAAILAHPVARVAPTPGGAP